MVCACVMNDKLKWGPAIWNLLHAVPAMLKSVHNIHKAVELINNIYLLLPCEECHNHAKEYLFNNRIMITNYQDLNVAKKEIKLYLFNFHNEVNQRLSKLILHSFDQYCNENNDQVLLNKINYSEISAMQYNQTNKQFYEQHLTEEQRNINNNLIGVFINL